MDKTNNTIRTQTKELIIMKETDVPKISSIIRTFLITTGPRTAREISETEAM